MLHQTRGIVLHSVKYSETSLIVKIYTEAFGIQSYMVKGARSPKSRFRSILFQPMILLDLVVYRKERNVLQNIREVRMAHPYQSIPFDIRKSSIAIFMDELIYRSLREEEPNPSLFNFLWDSCLLLDSTDHPFHHFHLLFAMKLTRHLGFRPRTECTHESCYFNLAEGIFQPLFVADICLDRELSQVWCKLHEWPLEEPALPGLFPRERDAMLDAILRYYRLHLPGLPVFRSAEILHQVLS